MNDDGRQLIDCLHLLSFSRVGKLIKGARVERMDGIVDLARAAGLGDSAKVLRNLDRLEREGTGPVDLVRNGHRFGGCLVLGPSEAVWFQEDGTSFVSDNGFTPHSRVRGRAFVRENLAGPGEPGKTP